MTEFPFLWGGGVGWTAGGSQFLSFWRHDRVEFPAYEGGSGEAPPVMVAQAIFLEPGIDRWARWKHGTHFGEIKLDATVAGHLWGNFRISWNWCISRSLHIRVVNWKKLSLVVVEGLEDCGWFRNPVITSSYVGYPIFYRVFIHPNGWLALGFLKHQGQRANIRLDESMPKWTNLMTPEDPAQFLQAQMSYVNLI